MSAVEAARAAAEQGDWDRVLSETTHHAASDEGLEIRASALYAIGDLEGSIAVWEQLHARCAASGQRVDAARCATMVALFLMMDTGMMAPVRGWLARAEHLLGAEPAGPVRAMLAMVGTYERFLSGDLERAGTHAAQAVELGEQHDVVMATVIGQVAQARLLALEGDIEAGVRALAEAGARLMSGAVDPMTTGMMFCEIICAAQGLAMPDLAQEWTDTMEQLAPAALVGSMRGRCRIHRAELLRISGPGERAEAVALEACTELRPWMRREYGWPLTELGVIRLRTGDLVGAEEAFLAADALAWPPQPGLALLRLAQGDVHSASVLIADAIAHPPDLPWKERPPSGELCLAPLLDAQAEIAAASGDVSTCAAVAERLGRIARDFPVRGIAAQAGLAQARAALLRGEYESSQALAMGAARRWADLGAPYESAVARLVAGDASAAAGGAEAARHEWSAAARGFASYGAVRGVAEAERRLDGSGVRAPRTALVATFRRDGGVRIIRFGAAESTVPDLLGYRYLEQLLRRPGEEVAAVDMVDVEHGVDGPPQLGLPAIDEQAREAYRRRLQEVTEDIDEATASHDHGRAEKARGDREFLIAELSRAVGLGGRMRTVGGDAERARTSVFRAIHYAMDRLAPVDPALGDHLRRSIRTGSWCSYTPDPLAPVSWQR